MQRFFEYFAFPHFISGQIFGLPHGVQQTVFM